MDKKINVFENVQPGDEFYENLEQKLTDYIKKCGHRDSYKILQDAFFTVMLINAWADDEDKKKGLAAIAKIMRDVRKSNDVIKIEFLEFFTSTKAFMPNELNLLKFTKDSLKDEKLTQINEQLPFVKTVFDGWVLRRLTEIHHFKKS